MKKIKQILLCMFYVLGAAIFAIAVHVFWPSPGAAVDVTDFDSILVQKFSFPLVACAYFIILYLHIFIVIRYFGTKATINNKEIGWRFGLTFALIYLVGMQEVVVSASPLNEYGMDYVLFQLFMGLGDAIPAMVFCVLVCRFSIKTIKTEKKSSTKRNVFMVSVITVLFFIERVIGYVAGYLDSDIKEYPIPVLIWTLIFGITLGCAYCLLRPIYHNENSSMRTMQIVILPLESTGYGLTALWD